MTRHTTHNLPKKISLLPKLPNVLALSALVRTLIVLPAVVGMWLGVYWSWVDGSLV